jgi:hypothetical protein
MAKTRSQIDLVANKGRPLGHPFVEPTGTTFEFLGLPVHDGRTLALCRLHNCGDETTSDPLAPRGGDDI